MYAFFFLCRFFLVCFFVCVCVNTDIDVGLKKTKNGEKKKRRSCDLFCFFTQRKTKTEKKQNREEKQKIEKKTENEREQRKECSTKVEETNTCEELVVLTENNNCATPLLSTHIRLLRFMLFSCFLFC